MGDWGFLYTLLDKVQSHSTVIGKIWVRVLFVFRILVLGTAAVVVWGDEQSSFKCNTQQPGCENVCYDQKFPISQIRFWIIQLIIVSTPMLLFLCHVIHVIHQEIKQRAEQHDSQMAKKSKDKDDQGQVKINCSLACSYITQLFFKIILELAFIIGQYYLYGFTMSPLFMCSTSLCPHSVECFISRATEKSIFNIFMLAVACGSLLLNVIEVVYLLYSRGRRREHEECHRNTTSAEKLHQFVLED